MTDKIQGILTKHDQIVKELNAKKKELAEQGKFAMQEAFKEFFEAVPGVQAVKWTQYTPYFNDGDECRFRVNDYSIYFDGDDVDDEGLETWALDRDNSYGESDRKRVQEEAPDLFKFLPILTSIFSLPNEVFLDVFDNHVEIIATKDGFTVNEYEHD